MRDLITELKTEQSELDSKRDKLKSFIFGKNSTFNTIPQEHRDLLLAQMYAMGEYSEILEKRINILQGD